MSKSHSESFYHVKKQYQQFVQLPNVYSSMSSEDMPYNTAFKPGHTLKRDNAEKVNI